MTSILLWLAILTLGFTSFLSAIHLSLLQVSGAQLERRLVAAGRASAAEWLLSRLDSAGRGVALLRTFGRVGFFAIVLAEVVGLGEAVPLTPTRLILSAVISGTVLWFFTSVLAQAVADHGAVGTVIRGMPIIRIAHAVAAPVSWLCAALDEIVRRLSGANLTQPDAGDELRRSIEETHREGGLDARAAELLENVVEFTGTDVGEVMTPRTDIEGIEYTDDLAMVRARIVESGHSRIPVYQGNLDEIVGILYVKDLIRYLGTDASDFTLRPLLRIPIRIPETKRVSELLVDFQRSEVHMAIVIDEYGGTSGLVTIEDVLEEIVGEIRDEHEAEDEDEPEFVREGNTIEADGRIRIDELNDEFGLELPEDDGYDTVAGLVLAASGRVPARGESIEVGGIHFTVVSATPTQVSKVRIDLPECAGEES